MWDRLAELRRRRASTARSSLAAWANGQAFLHAAEGLRGRPPRLVEWKGPTQAPGDEVVPADLRVDHVWLVSCKYLSKVLANAAPGRLFDRGLAGGPSPHGGRLVRGGGARRLPGAVRAGARSSSARARRCRRTPPTSRPAHRAELRAYLDAGWSPEAQAAYRTLAVGGRQGVGRPLEGRRSPSGPRPRRCCGACCASAARPYFVLGAQRDRTPAAPGDDAVGLAPGLRAQAHRRVGRRRRPAPGPLAGRRSATGPTGEERTVDGHVEVRWSHGRFGKPPEAKVYLDTPHHRVPGYVPLQ